MPAVPPRPVDDVITVKPLSEDGWYATRPQDFAAGSSIRRKVEDRAKDRAADRADADACADDRAGASAFGTTGFDHLPMPRRRAPEVVSAFDVCHVAVALRAVLFVESVVAIGAMFAARSAVGWVEGFAVATAVALPGVLCWLLVACVLKRPLARLPAAGQWTAAALLGLAAGAASASQLWIGDLRSGGAASLLAPAMAGAAMASALFAWLRLRAELRLPADSHARLAELQSRIRPHFLFNTLNSAIALVRVDPPKAEAVLEDLAELFRVALDETGAAVALSEEVELARRYLEIEQVRFGSRLQVAWELDELAGTARVPPLLLQPLVENAVRHGVEGADAGGVIRIRTRIRRSHAVLSIANTVAPGPARPGNGMALRNVRERLRLMHDVAAQFDTRFEAGVFRVQIVVPL
ncbi:MAG: histidine kinase [Rhizobacter sp.]|nr:histidine kinase [Rhizobacter sp.]